MSSTFNLYAKPLAIVTFLPISWLAFQVIFGHITRSGTAQLSAQCPSPYPTSGKSASPAQLHYTNVPAIDNTLCTLVAFFTAALYPSNLPFIFHMGNALIAVVIIPIIEAARNGRSILLALPLITGYFYQTLTGGVTFPIFILAFILAGHARLTSTQAAVPQAHAESIVFAIFAGYLLPSIFMLTTSDPRAIAVWQAFPLWMTISQYAYKAVVRRPAGVSGYISIQTAYAITFILSIVSHAMVVWTRATNLTALREIFIPPIQPEPTSVVAGALSTLQWDNIFILGSAMLGTLWYARSAKEVAALVAWHVGATLAFGPGAAIAGASLWRESYMQPGNTKGEKEL